MGNFGEILGILVQKYQRGEVIFFVSLKLGTLVGHEKLNFAIFEFYDFAKKNQKKIRFNFLNFDIDSIYIEFPCDFFLSGNPL